jgi:hypothetical protein
MDRIINLHAHVFTPGGSALGVVDEIWAWKGSDPLDAAGDWKLEFRAKQANLDLIGEGRRFDVYGTIQGVERQLSTGFMDSRQTKLNLAGSSVQIAGGARLSELGHRNIPYLLVAEKQWVRLIRSDGVQRGAVRWLHTDTEDETFEWADDDRPSMYDNSSDDPTQPDLTTANGMRLMAEDWDADYEQYRYHYWMVGFDARYSQVMVNISTPCSVAMTLRAQYYNGYGWVDLTVTDGTYVAGLGTMRQSGVISWTIPDDWVRSTPTALSGEWFWVRFTSNSGRSNSISIRDVYVYSDGETTNALNLIMAHAPSGWKTSGYAAMAAPAYDTMEDVSVLQALERLRSQIGGHYIAVNNGGTMEIQWLTSFASSGITISGSAEVDATHARMSDLTPSRDLTEYVSRVYPRCDSAELALTTRSSTGAYVLSKVDGYIRNATAETTYGRRDRAVKFDITQQQNDSYVEHPALAANALFDLALQWLMQHDQVADFYDVSAFGFYNLLRPGQTIDVETTQVVDEDTVISISETLNVISVDMELDDGGLLAASLEVTTIERAALTDAQVIAQAISNQSGGVGGSGGAAISVVVNETTVGMATNADTVDGFHASQTPLPATILVLDNYGRLPPVMVGGFEFAPTFIRDIADSFGMSSVVSGGDDTRFWAGATFANRGSAPFRVSESGVVHATNAYISGEINATTGELVNLDVSGTLNLIEAGILKSDNFAADLAGWQIDYLGNAEFSNVKIRGTLSTMVFEKEIISAHAGSLIISKSAGKLVSDYTVGSTLVVDDPPSGGWLFDTGDILRMRAVNNSGVVTDTWVTVTRSATTNQYTTSYEAGTDSVVYPAGTAVVDYGQSGDGVLLLTADETNGPYYSVAVHSGSPWSSQDLVARLGNLNGAYGLATDIYGLGLGDYAGGVYLLYDGEDLIVEGGVLRTGAGAQRVEMSVDGLFGHLDADTKTFLLANNSISSWGGFTSLSAGAIVLGHNKSGKSALFWNPDTGNLSFFGNGKSDPNIKLMGADGALAVRRFVDSVVNAGLVFRYNSDMTPNTSYDSWVAMHDWGSGDVSLDFYAPAGFLKMDAGPDAGKGGANYNFMRLALASGNSLAKLHPNPVNAGTDVTFAMGNLSNTWAYLKATNTPGLKLAIGTGANPTEWVDFRGHTIPSGWGHVLPQVVWVEADVPTGGEQGILAGIKYIMAVLASFDHTLAVKHGHLMCSGYKPTSGYDNHYFSVDDELVAGGDTDMLLYINSSGGVALKNNTAHTLRITGLIWYFTA